MTSNDPTNNRAPLDWIAETKRNRVDSRSYRVAAPGARSAKRWHKFGGRTSWNATIPLRVRHVQQLNNSPYALATPIPYTPEFAPRSTGIASPAGVTASRTAGSPMIA